MAKVFTIARKSVVNGAPTYTNYGPDIAFNSRIEATKALRAAGGGQQGDDSLVIWSYNTADRFVTEPVDREYEVAVLVRAASGDAARDLAAAIGEVVDVGEVTDVT